jgi:hypothetical protein
MKMSNHSAIGYKKLSRNDFYLQDALRFPTESEKISIINQFITFNLQRNRVSPKNQPLQKIMNSRSLQAVCLFLAILNLFLARYAMQGGDFIRNPVLHF